MSEFDNKLAVNIDGKRFVYWERIRLSFALDNISSAEFDAPFDYNDLNFREAFKPFSFKPISVSINDQLLFNGTMAVVNPSFDTQSSKVAVGAYALPGVLGDCPTPYVNFKKLYQKQDLYQITEDLLRPYGLNFKTELSAGPVFKKVTKEPDQTVMDFLAELAKERNQLISNTIEGDLLFRQAIESGVPTAFLVQGESPLLSVSANFSPNNYYSEITGLKPITVRAKRKIQFTLTNTLLQGVVRPHVFDAPDTRDVDLLESVKGKVGRMFGNMLSYTVSVATWRDGFGDLWQPNTIVRVKAPGAMIYNPTDFLIRNVTLRQGVDGDTAELDCVLPGSFTSNFPGGMPWD